jgi:acyl carrier protein
MTEDQIREVVSNALASLAPDADVGSVEAGVDFRTTLGLDSFDFLRLMQAVHTATGVTIPEDDYGTVTSIHGLTVYISAHGGQATPHNASGDH